ncbi:unnamed protein product [Phaeothamnion confervicola]
MDPARVRHSPVDAHRAPRSLEKKRAKEKRRGSYCMALNEEREKKADKKGNTSRVAHAIPGIAGICAGAITALTCSPLDVAKIRIICQDSIPGQRRYTGTFQTLRAILTQEGVRGWYRGISPALVSIPLFWASFFAVYEYTKPVLREWTGKEQHVLSAISAGAVTDVVTNPWWVVRTRMQTQILHAHEGVVAMTMLQTFRTICRDEGVLSLYRGLTASFLGLTHVAIQIPVYEKLKAVARQRRGGCGPDDDRASDLVAASALSKLTGSVASYPHEVLRARMQDERGGKGLRRRGLFATAAKMVREEGATSLYSGFRLNILRVVPSCVATFVSYELIARELRRRWIGGGGAGSGGGRGGGGRDRGGCPS